MGNQFKMIMYTTYIALEYKYTSHSEFPLAFPPLDPFVSIHVQRKDTQARSTPK